MMMHLRMAASADLEDLVKIRFAYFEAENFSISPAQREQLTAQLGPYFETHLNRDFFAALAEDDGTIAASAFLAVAEKPANPKFPTGKTGTVLNVFTYPAYRRRGYATAAMKALMDVAKQQDLSYIELSASRSGKPLYQKLGFEERDLTKVLTTEMRLALVNGFI